jgi:hypothetical protein
MKREFIDYTSLYKAKNTDLPERMEEQQWDLQ